MLTFLHGFLGAPEDWEEVISYLPSHLKINLLSYPFNPPDEGVLIGYSMGGRIALSYPHPKILLSAHLGLEKGHEQRAQEEEIWIKALQTLSLDAFLEKWYAQPLFNTLRDHPSFGATLKRRLSQDPALLLKQLQNHRLSQQPLYTNPPQTCFMHGEHDLKYAKHYSGKNSFEIIRSGHACHIENPQECARGILYSLEKLGGLL